MSLITKHQWTAWLPYARFRLCPGVEQLFIEPNEIKYSGGWCSQFFKSDPLTCTNAVGFAAQSIKQDAETSSWLSWPWNFWQAAGDRMRWLIPAEVERCGFLWVKEEFSDKKKKYTSPKIWSFKTAPKNHLRTRKPSGAAGDRITPKHIQLWISSSFQKQIRFSSRTNTKQKISLSA